MKRFLIGVVLAGLALVGLDAYQHRADAGLITISGSRGATTTSSSYDADWTTRSTASGVFLSNNFTYKDAAKTQLITNDADLRESMFGSSQSGTAAYTQWESSIKLSGNGSLKLYMPAADANSYAEYRQGFDGINATTKNTIKHVFYLQFAIYADSTYYNFFYGSNNTWGSKLAIIESANATDDTGEVVLRRADTPGGYLTAYRRVASSGVANPFTLFWSAYSDYTYSTFIDRGAPVVSSINTLQQRHGFDYSHLGDSLDNDTDTQHDRTLNSNGWTVFEFYIDQTNDIVKVWRATYGSAPELWTGAMAAGLPSASAVDSATPNVALFTGVSFNNYCGGISCGATSWPASDTYLLYAEVIGSDSPIDFPNPGGTPYSLTSLYPGTQTPTGYPPMGAVEQGISVSSSGWIAIASTEWRRRRRRDVRVRRGERFVA